MSLFIGFKHLSRSLQVHHMQWKDRTSPLRGPTLLMVQLAFHNSPLLPVEVSYLLERNLALVSYVLSPSIKHDSGQEQQKPEPSWVFLQCKDQMKELIEWMLFQLVLILLYNQWLLSSIVSNWMKYCWKYNIAMVVFNLDSDKLNE